MNFKSLLLVAVFASLLHLDARAESSITGDTDAPELPSKVSTPAPKVAKKQKFQGCTLASELDRVKKEEMKGDEIITHSYLVRQWWVTVDGDENNSYIQGPFDAEAEGKKAKENCEATDYFPFSR